MSEGLIVSAFFLLGPTPTFFLDFFRTKGPRTPPLFFFFLQLLDYFSVLLFFRSFSPSSLLAHATTFQYFIGFSDYVLSRLRRYFSILPFLIPFFETPPA